MSIDTFSGHPLEYQYFRSMFREELEEKVKHYNEQTNKTDQIYKRGIKGSHKTLYPLVPK